MTVKQYFKAKGWCFDCTVMPCCFMNVCINFVNSDGRDDETEFSIRAYDIEELSTLFTDFCKENGFKRNTVQAVVITQMAATYDELQ